jgi:hypothetical protein
MKVYPKHPGGRLSDWDCLQLVLTFRGDCRMAFFENGTHCPYHLDREGNTVVISDTPIRRGLHPVERREVLRMIRRSMIRDVRPYGRLLSAKWRKVETQPEVSAL